MAGSKTGTLPSVPSTVRPAATATGSLPRQSKRAARPSSKTEVIQWFKDVEWPRRVVCNKSGKICPWFHGKQLSVGWQLTWHNNLDTYVHYNMQIDQQGIQLHSRQN